ncbi:MAG: hypothetical protein IIW48_01315 [Clostridia bacterium]|nr:hypothetical protein [Clostridia bacterium]
MKNKSRYLAARIVSICLVAVLLFATGCGKKEEAQQTTQPEETATADVAATAPEAQQTTLPAEDSSATTQQSETTTQEQEQETNRTQTQAQTQVQSQTQAQSQPQTQTQAQSQTQAPSQPQIKAPSTTQEIVAYFNESANKIKTQAVSVTKNFEKRHVNKDRLVVPAGLESTADSMISSFMKDDNDPIVYTGKDEIKENFIVPGQSYVSKLDPAYVTTAACTDNGNTYKIYLKLKSQTSPTAGAGIGAVCDVIEANEVADKAPFVEKFTTEYYNCEITATVDKATGRVTSIVYSTPLTLNITVNMFGTHDLVIGFTFVKDYTVKY